MSYYEDLKSRNYIRLVEPLLKAGVLSMRGSDGKFVANLSVEYGGPWVHTKPSYETNCFWWKDVTFHTIVEKCLPAENRFVPIGCQDCFKVVVRPKTLRKLFDLEKLQGELNLPSKCGIEIRPSVNGNYGGYFYNRGLPAGLECWKVVRKAVDDRLGSDVAVILKRACTEMEHAMGRSDEWTVTPKQISFEMEFAQRCVNDLPVIIQSDHAKDEVRQKWIEHAYSVGDQTYAEFTDGPLYPDYVTYQHLLEEQEG
jgi:hypothetical protein